MNKIVCLLLVVQSVLVDILSLKQIIIFLHFVPPIFCTVLSIAQSSGVPGPLAWCLVTSVPRARTQISNVTIIHVGYSQGEPEPGWEGRRPGISFIIYISPGCLNELSDTAAVWGQPGPAQLSDPVYIEPQERSVSVSGFS